MQDLILNHLGELVVGIVLTVFGFGFRSWSNTISESTRTIIAELKTVSRDLHNLRIETERRVTRVETKLEIALKDRE